MQLLILITIFLVFLVACCMYNKKYNKSNFQQIPSIKIEEKNLKHPVLEYQQQESQGRTPAVLGDPLRPVLSAGPNHIPGPQIGKPLGIPVPRNALKETSERYKTPFYYAARPNISFDYFRPYGPNQLEMQETIVPSDIPFYNQTEKYLSPALPGYGFFGSANAFDPAPEVLTSWEKAGILTTVNPNNDSILNIYRRPIAPLQDLFEYVVQDKNGFIIKLDEKFIEDGDIVPRVPGKENKGKWQAKMYIQNKYVWV